MKPIRTFTLVPSLPPQLERLRDLAYNLRWSWDHGTIELFRRLDSDLWESSGHNPVRLLGSIDQARLEMMANDQGFLAHLEGTARYFDQYMAGSSSWFKQSHDGKRKFLVAYFCAEFGITECLSIFAGGLGILAGDHVKSASDLGVPMVGVGLLYQQGYFRQYLNEAGWQQEAYEDNDFYGLPLHLECQPDGTPLTIQVPYPERSVTAQVWRAQVGRVPVYLLDTNVPSNNPDDRDITDQLYGGDREMRLKQEILLGIGGLRTLEAMGIEPSVYHMNEGHSAFLGLERIRRLIESNGLTFEEAREVAAVSLVFTTHTPVGAGHDFFEPEKIDRYLHDYASALRLSRRDFLGLGRQNPDNEGEEFCMTVLSLRLAGRANGVSRLHGRVSRQMWSDLWPGVPENEIPISHNANGVHFRSWISREMDSLYDRYLGPRWKEQPLDQEVWSRASQIPSEELWRTHERRRQRLVVFARHRLQSNLRKRGMSPALIETAAETLGSDILTLGFARRFATYKRANLILRDPDRLDRILNNPERPVQIIFAGKAHPRDDEGKELIRQIVGLARQQRFRQRIVFLEDYDVAIARYLVQGCDVWVNTPLRPREASGTSGMKAAANGVLNISTKDGWWDEVWETLEMDHVGWTIGRGEDYEDPDYQDQVEASSLYDLLEFEIAPVFYERGPDGLPRRWIKYMKESLAGLCHFFNTHRMVREYSEYLYLPASDRHAELAKNHFARARSLASWKSCVQAEWPKVKVAAVNGEDRRVVRIGEKVKVEAKLFLGDISPDSVAVELYHGPLDAEGDILFGGTLPMRFLRREADGACLYRASLEACSRSGQHGYTVRVIPRHPDLYSSFVPGLIRWA
jgi:glycogen phosphorylase